MTSTASAPVSPAPAAVAASEEELAELKKIEVQKVRAEYRDFSHTQRLGMPAIPRVSLTVLAGGTYGLMSGFYGGFKRGSLQFLALNAHRLPKTKGAWYFYHKRKNYVVLKSGFLSGFRGAFKFGTATGAYFGLEAYLDYIRGTIDFLSTTTAATTVGVAYALTSRLSKVQTMTSARNAFLFGLGTGLIQDGLRYMRGNDVWYLPSREPADDEE